MTGAMSWEAQAVRLIRAVRAHEPRIEEGRVDARGPARYRRLDCDGRALAYVVPRPRKGCLRIDLSPAWRWPPSRLAVASASGIALVVRTEEDLERAVDVLVSAVREA